MTKKYTRHVDFKRLDFVVQSIKNVLKATIISALMSLVKNRVYTSRSGLVKGLKRKGGLGRIYSKTTITGRKVLNEFRYKWSNDIRHRGGCRYFHRVFCSLCRKEG